MANPGSPPPPTALRHSRWLDWCLWLLGRRRRWRVAGESMLPLLHPGEEVLMAPRRGAPAPGTLVVMRHPQRPGLPMVKWVAWIEADGRCYVKGLNAPHSTDSRQFGPVDPGLVEGQILCRFP